MRSITQTITVTQSSAKHRTSSNFNPAVFDNLYRLLNVALTGLPEDRFNKELWSKFESMPILTLLMLRGSITDNSIRKMPHLRNLKQLYLQDGQLSGRTVVDVASRLPKLKELKLFRLQLGDADIQQLKSLTSLTTLEIQANNDVTSPAVKSLHEALPTCRIVSDHGTFEAAATIARPADN